MTLQNGLVHKGKGYLWTDTALFDASSGKVIGSIEKAFCGTQWPWAAVLSGVLLQGDPYRVQTLIAEAQPSNPSDLLQAATEALRGEALAGRNCRLLISHACSEHGARLWFIAADDTPFAKPFQPEELVELTSSGAGSSEYARLDRKGMTPARMRRFARWQAENPCETVLGWPQRLGGNHIEIEVDARGVAARQVGRFKV